MTVKDDIVKGNALLIDVRGRDEFAEKHIKGAQNLPVDQIEAAGYTDVHNLKTLEAVEALGLRSES